MVAYRRALSWLLPAGRSPGAVAAPPPDPATANPLAANPAITDPAAAGQTMTGPAMTGPVAAGQTMTDPAATAGASSRITRIAVNVAGAAFAALFAYASLEFFLRTHQLLGAGFLLEQTWFVVAFLVRRPARTVSRRRSDWLLAIGGSFGGTLFRPQGAHPVWGNWAGLACQIAGLLIGLAALIALGRSFGVAPADRGLVTSGPYAIVRHPIYTSYLLVECGYLLQALSWPNAAVAIFTAGCNIGRALAEERLLLTGASSALGYPAYRDRVRWRLIPTLWL